MFDRLVRRTVFAEPDGIMGVDEDIPQLHQRRHSQGIAGVVRERQKRAGIGNYPAVQSQAIANCGHTEFADAEEKVVARRVLAGHGH